MTTKTKTKSPSATLARLQTDRDSAHAETLQARRERDAYDQATESMRAELTARASTFPGEFSGPTKLAKEGTEAAKLTATIKQRLADPNPHQAEYEAKRDKFHALDEQVNQFTRATLGHRVAEVAAEAEVEVERIREALALLEAASDSYLDVQGRVWELVIPVAGMSTQHLSADPRPAQWIKQAREALDSEITLPHLTDLGVHRLSELSRTDG